MVRDLHGVPERAGLTMWLGRAWCRAEAPGVVAGRGGGHPQAELVGGRFRRWAGWCARRPTLRGRGPGSGDGSLREGLLGVVAGVGGEDGEVGRVGGASVTSATKVVKRVHSWRAPSVARWQSVSSVHCPSRSALHI